MSTLDRTYDLPAFAELRLRTPFSPPIKVVLHHNSEGVRRAEIFGSELIPGVSVTLPTLKSLAIFTPTGCQLTITASPGALQDCYATVTGSVWMRSLTDIHTHLEVCRQKAKKEVEFGPRVLFVSDRRRTGCSTYAKLLSQFAVRIGYHPLLLDGVVTNSSFGYPGCISLFQLQYPLDIEEEMDFVPGVHTFMGASRTRQPQLYLKEVHQMGTMINEKMSRSAKSRVGGLFVDYGVINHFSVLEAEENSSKPDNRNPLDTLLHTIMELDIDHVCVVHSAWLRFKLIQRAQELLGVRMKPDDLVPNSSVTCENGLTFKVLLVDAIEVGSPPFPDFTIKQQMWMRHFFGTVTSPLQPEVVQLDLWIPGEGSKSSSHVPGKVRIATLGTTEKSSMSTLVPMSDGETEEVLDPCAVSFASPLDLSLKRGTILAISTATEFESLQDGSIQPLPYPQFESAIKKATIKGFAIVESVMGDKLSVLVTSSNFNKDLGVCFFLSEEPMLVQ